MKTFTINTPYGHHYVIAENGNVLESVNGKLEGNGSWRILGLEQILPFNNLRFIPLKQVLSNLDKFSWKFKNGRPRYTVRDLDNGTTRVWGNWNIHGVSSISR